MKIYIVTLIFILISVHSFGQKESTWFSFWNKDTTVFGFKDKNGIIKIKPKFNGFSTAKKFDDIIAVSENTNGKMKSYYLTKAGKVIGKDNLYIYDNTFDCESEGFIRFKNAKTNKVGLYNKFGKVVIPAIYNGLSSVSNGMLTGLKGAQKKYWDNDKHSGCNHFSWVGGEEVLLDTLNNVLVSNFSHDNKLNFFSIQKTRTANMDSTRKYFLSKDGNYFSFVDYEKEFKSWITNNVLKNITQETLVASAYDSIIFESKDGWGKAEKKKFITKNFEILTSGLLELQQPFCDYFITSNGLNPFIYEGKEFEKYYNNCGESKDWIYPIMDIIISHKEANDITQNHFEFLRTDNGYKFISVSIRNAALTN